MKYFAYGSNCNPAILRRKGVEFTDRQRAELRGYRLMFNKKSLRAALPDNVGFANINEDAAGVVEGILYEIADTSLGRLDESERYPDHYDRVVVEVADEGPGIPPEQMRTLFQPFRSATPGGFGIGLYESKRIVESYGGGMRVDSTPGSGTRIIVELPFAAATESPPAADEV